MRGPSYPFRKVGGPDPRPLKLRLCDQSQCTGDMSDMNAHLSYSIQGLARTYEFALSPLSYDLHFCSRVAQKNCTLYSCPYLCKILTDFHNSFTDTFSRKFAIKLLIKIPPHLKCVATLACEILKAEKLAII